MSHKVGVVNLPGPSNLLQLSGGSLGEVRWSRAGFAADRGDRLGLDRAKTLMCGPRENEWHSLLFLFIWRETLRSKEGVLMEWKDDGMCVWMTVGV